MSLLGLDKLKNLKNIIQFHGGAKKAFLQLLR